MTWISFFLSYDYTLTSKAPQFWNIHKKCNQMIYNTLLVWKIIFLSFLGAKPGTQSEKRWANHGNWKIIILLAWVDFCMYLCNQKSLGQLNLRINPKKCIIHPTPTKWTSKMMRANMKWNHCNVKMKPLHCIQNKLFELLKINNKPPYSGKENQVYKMSLKYVRFVYQFKNVTFCIFFSQFN